VVSAKTALVLGIDAGGTKTAACVARVAGGGSFRILGKGKAGAGNPVAVGFEEATQNIERAMAAACRNAGLVPRKLNFAVLAGAGSGTAERQAALLEWMRSKQVASCVEIVPDPLAVLAAASPSLWGIALVAGTGSIAWGQDRRQRSARAGGWGYFLGDQGSGYQIGLAALRAVCRAADGLDHPTQLTQFVFSELRLKSVAELPGYTAKLAGDPQRVAGLARGVVKIARSGDIVASRIVEQAARDLAELVAGVARRLGFDGPFPLALSGGVLSRSIFFRENVLAKLKLYNFAPEPIEVVREPLMGCIRLAIHRWMLGGTP